MCLKIILVNLLGQYEEQLMKRLIRLTATSLFVIVLAACNVAAPVSPDEVTLEDSALGYVYATLKVGAGGFVTSIDFSPDGSTVLVRADTYGGYRLDTASKTWQQLVLAPRLPVADRDINTDNKGVYEIVSAPSRPSRAYMAWNDFVYRSDNAGVWTRTSAPSNVNRNANEPQEYSKDGPKMSVDPRNPEVVIVGAQDYKLSEAPTQRARAYISNGSTWREVTGLPLGLLDGDKGRGVNVVLFDPSSPALANGNTSGLYASVYRKGVYRSSDGGVRWTLTKASRENQNGAPVSIAPEFLRQMSIANDGTLYGVDNEIVWRYREGGAWQKVTPDGGISSVAVNSKNSQRVVAIKGDGTFFFSNDGGANWSAPLPYTVAASDVPWLATSSAREYFSPGELMFDPKLPNRIWVTQGTGVWYADIATNMTSVRWQSISAGIEELVGNEVMAPPTGKPVVAAWDFGTFYIDNPDTYRTKQAVSSRFNSTWDLDYMVQSNGSVFMVGNTSDHRIGCYFCLVDGKSLQAGYSVDGGQTWTPFARFPAPAYGDLPDADYGQPESGILPLSSQWAHGNIAVNSGDPNNIIWMPSGDKDPYYTTNRGQSWNKVTLPGLVQNGQTGSHFALFLNRRVLVADKTTRGVFYLAHSGQTISETQFIPGGLFRTNDGGRNWTKIYSTKDTLFPFGDGGIYNTSNFNAILKSVPGKAGHLFFTAGPLDGDPTDNFLYRSTNGGSQWQAVTSILHVRSFGFGKAAPDSSYPTLFAAGFVNGVYALWRSTNEGASWERVGKFPRNSLDYVKDIDGDKTVFGRFYMAFGGSGFGYAYSATGQ
jgi:hypothetical protein